MIFKSASISCYCYLYYNSRSGKGLLTLAKIEGTCTSICKQHVIYYSQHYFKELLTLEMRNLTLLTKVA